MSDVTFFPRRGTLTISAVCEMAGIDVPAGVDGATSFAGTAPIEHAGPDDLVYMNNAAYVDELPRTLARACLTSRRFAARVPSHVIPLVCADPYRVFAQATGALYPTALRPESLFGVAGVYPGAVVHPTARIERNVTVDPGAVIGPDADIGSGSVIGANTVIGPGVKIGRDCSIAAQVTIQAAFIGNRVIIHPGVRIGQDGFGFAMGPRGHLKVPQTGRVIIQDDVEIGANSTVDRGANRDTVIGEGTKIDNQVQIGHNAVIGRHCVIVAQVGISGSATLDDFVVMGGQAGVVGHVRIGAGAQVAGRGAVTRDVPSGQRWGGAPAKPFRDYGRELAAVARLARSSTAVRRDENEGEG